MPQAGIHAIAGMLSRKWIPRKEWLLTGVVLGNLFPDLDNLVVAYATLSGAETHGLHRTFTHSIFTILVVFVLSFLIAEFTKNPNWKNFGLGFGSGILMHILLDLILWFNGVELLWPIRYQLNFWNGFAVPAWLGILLDTGEFLAFGLYLLLLGSLARREGTDRERLSSSKTWAYVEFALFLLFTLLFFIGGTDGLPYTIFGALYLLSLVVAIILTLQMRKTIEVFAS